MRLLRYAVLCAAGALTCLTLYVVLGRLGFPYELEWMTGSVLDHIERIRSGQPLYTPPTTLWIPYIYPPLYYWLAAPFTHAFFGCRVLSLLAALLQSGCIWILARHHGASRFWSILGVLLFWACYPYIGFWYDIERSDTLFVAMMLVATVLLEKTRSLAGALAAGIVAGLGFYAKQPAVLFIAAGAAALAWRREWARAAGFAVLAAVIIAGGTRVLDAASEGWFSYYVWKLPSAHGVDLRLVSDVMGFDVPRGPLFFVVTFAGMAWFAWTRSQKDVLLVAMLAAGFAGAMSSRLHVGGWINVLQQWTSFACLALAIAGGRVIAWASEKSWGTRATVAVHVALLAQLALWLHDPRERMPDATMERDTAAFLSIIHGLEAQGEVMVVGRGHVTTPTHFQMSGLADVTRVSGAPKEVSDTLHDRRLAAIVDDARFGEDRGSDLWPAIMLEDVPDLREPLLANYYIGMQIEEPLHRLAMAAPARPRFVYFPRKAPTTGSLEMLKKRQQTEIKLAARLMIDAREGKTSRFRREDIEALAEGADAASYF